MKKLLIFCFVTMLISSAVFAEKTNLLEKTDADTNQVEKVEEKIEKAHRPSYGEVAQSIKSLGSNLKKIALLNCLKILKINGQKNVDKLFEDFYKKSEKVFKKSESNKATRYKKELSSKKSKKLYGKLTKEESENFVIIYPEKLAFKKGKNEIENFDVSAVLSAANDAFSKMTEMLMMTKFMYWPGKTRGKIYIVPNIEIWKLIKKGVSKKQPAQTVMFIPETREIFILVDKTTFQEADKATAYSVAKAVLNEYSEVVSGESKPKFPQFFVIGLAANAADLDSVLTDEDGPEQLYKFEGKLITPKKLRCIKEKKPDFFPLPLYRKNLFKIKELISNPYPSRAFKNEPGYYYIRQSKAVINYLQQNGTLPFLILTKELADGKDFKKSFKDYIDLRDELRGKRDKKKNKDKKNKKERKEEKDRQEAAEVCLDGYKEFLENVKEVVFEPMTYEDIKGVKEDERKDKKKSKRKGGRKGK